MDLANHQQTPGNHIVPDCSSNGQLPDESYIEKLFPKCPPKQSQAKTMNNFRNLNGDKGGARQQHRRQNRSKFHQHHRREPLVADTATPTTRKDNSIQKPDINPSDLNNNSGKCNDIDYDSSSSGSTDKDIRANCESGYSGLKRSGSNQYGFDCKNRPNQADSLQTNGQQNNTANSSRQRARRYKATKNLQPRIRRSQSIQNRFNPPLLPLDSSKQLENDPSSTGTVLSDASSATLTATTMTSTTTTILAPISSEPAISTLISSQSNGNGSSMRTSMHGETSSLSNSSIKPKSFSTPEERRMDSKSINRTCRGIVFSEPLLTFNEANNTNEQLATSSTSILAANQQGAIESCSTAQLESSSPLMGPVAQMPPTLTTLRQEKGDEITADSSLNNTRLDTTKVAPQSVETVTETTIASPNLHDPVWENRRQLLTPIEDTNINNDGTSLMLEVDDNLKDDDKYINLFVYDNTGPHRKTSGTEVLDETKQRLDSPKQQQQDSKTPISDQYQPGHRLLTEDLSENEQDVIRNDTSTEELCSLADNDTENTKHKAAQKAVQSDFFSSIPEESIIGPEITTNSFVANKTHSKYHRPIGTLQTVDEKAELTADTDAVTADASNSSKIELIDIGGSSTMQSEDGLKILKKAGATPAPGFPRRVRSQLQPSINNNVEISPQVLPTTTMAKEHLQSTTGVDQSPAIKQTELTDSGPELLINSQTKNHTVDETEICQSSEQLALETDTNLSGALDKVSITKDSDTNSIDQTMFPSQYHKLPNESSHYSILRDMNKAQTIQTENVSVHRSRIHFNTLSDADSELDDQPNIEIRPNASSKTTTANSTDKKLDQIGETFTAGNSDTTRKIDDDLTPSNKTALIFPRLDEGLSSEAESCDDDIEEDDERAIEADVDADDEEGNDDDADSPTRSTNRSASVMLINVDQFLRQQQPQTSRTQNRLVGTSQQQQHPGINISGMQVVPDTDVQQIKQTSNSPYANFIGAHEPLDQTDLKSHPNYSNHNGQSNYWMGATSQTTMSAQPPASQNQQQFAIQRSQHHGNSNNGNDINMSRSNNYSNRDEAKTVNRLSSDTDNETDRLLGTQRNDQLQKMPNNELVSNNNSSVDSQTTNNFVGKQTSNSREVMIDGVLFNVKYLGSTHTECEGRGEKEDRIHQAELAVHEVKFRNGDSQAPVEVQLFISTEKIMVLDDKHRKIMMDHSLRTISYIADIGDAIVLIVRKKSTSMDTTNELGRPISKTSCHVFESNESHTITKSISQAFQVAYTELLKANGAGDTGSYLPKELDYQEVLNSQEMSTTELEMFARKDNQREVIVPKQEGEILGLSIVESGWGSVLPTAVIASLKQDGPAYRCKKLSVGDQILSINGISLVGLSLAECQKILRKTKSQSVARLSIVPCPITVEVKIKRPHTKYQLGFSVQHGVICSLLRGGIAERGGVRVGHRIISINGTTVVGVPHDKIVTLLASSVGEIRMKTCLTSLYRHILGEEKNVSFV